MNRLCHLLNRLRRDRRGSVAVMLAGGLVLFVGLGAFVVDIGYLYHVRRVMQTSADMAALAGAQDINSGSGGQAISTAVSYSGVSGNRNASPGLNITMASGYPALRCFSSTGISCSGPDAANGIIVKQQSQVPTFFAKIFGNSTIDVSVTSIAGKGGTVKPADVMVVLDTTASMNSVDPSCSIAGATRLDCAFAGFRTLLSGFSPTQNRVGLMVFPGLMSTGAAAEEYDCSSTTPAMPGSIAPYNASSNPPSTTPPVYLVVPLSNDYQNANGSLNSNSNLVKAARGGGSGCSAGVTAQGGVGTYFADAITAAKNYLATNARPGVQPIIILLSDGDANNATSAPGGQNACHRAITMAGQARAAGNTVITIAYGAPTSTTSSCPTDTASPISACSTLQQMASSTSTFYSDTVGGTSSCTSAANSATDLSAIFRDIAVSLSGARLLSENTM